jgi:hypothetical protein
MTRSFTALALAALALLVALGAARPPLARAGGYTAEERVAYVRRALAALAALGAARDSLELELATAARQKCGGGTQTPRLACLLEQAEQLCRSPGRGDPATCAAAADVILVNLRGAGELVDEPTRVRLVRTAADYHAALLAELRRRYAALAAELVLEDPAASAEPPISAAAIDRFCAGRDHRPRPPRCDAASPTCVPSLSWQRCAAALAWFALAAPTAPTAPPALPAPGAPASSPSPASPPAKERTP